MADSDGGGGIEKHFRWQWYVMGIVTGLFLAGIIFSVFSLIGGN